MWSVIAKQRLLVCRDFEFAILWSRIMSFPQARRMAAWAICPILALVLVPLVNAAAPTNAAVGSRAWQALETQELGIEAQIVGLGNQNSVLTKQVVNNTHQEMLVQTALMQTRQTLTQDMALLAKTNDRITFLNQQIKADSLELSKLTVSVYQTQLSPPGSLASIVTNSSGFNQMVSTQIAFQILQQQFQTTASQLLKDRQQAHTLQIAQAAQLAQVTADVDKLQSQQEQLKQSQLAIQTAQSHLTGEIKTLTLESQTLLLRLDSMVGVPAIATVGTGSLTGSILAVCSLNSHDPNCPVGTHQNAFPYGQCTWYVATRMAVTWSGNADQWITNASAAGAQIGIVPKVNSAVVFAAGGAYDPQYGHVAWVVKVLSPTSFVVDEANFIPNTQDERQINSLAGVLGFIYAP